MNIATPAVLAAIAFAAACTLTDPGTDAGPTAPDPQEPLVVVPGDTGPGAAGDTCGAAAVQQYVGQRSPQFTVPSGANLRQYRTGDPITMDLSPERLNLEYDLTGKLVKASCG